jgi:hypothetical protein
MTIFSNRATNSITVNGVEAIWLPSPETEALQIAGYLEEWNELVDEYVSGETHHHPLTRWDTPDAASYQSVVMPIVATAQAIPNAQQHEAPFHTPPIFRSSFVAYIVDPSFNRLGTCVWDRNFTAPSYTKNSPGIFFDNYENIRNLDLSSRITELTDQERYQLEQLKEDREYFEANITVQTNNILSIQMMAHIEWTSSKVVNYIMVSQDVADQLQGV